MDVTQVLALSLHTIGFVIAWGYYGVLGRIVLPALERSLDGQAKASALVEIERQAVPLVLLSAVLFMATGSYLLVINPHYAGPGNFFESTWATLMLVKHGFVIALIILAVTVDLLIRRVGAATSESARASALRLVGLSAEGVTGFGALVVLLTAAGQAAA